MPVDPYNLYAGYERVSSYNPVDRPVLKKAVQPYGLKFSDRSRYQGVAPQDLRSLATQLVLKRFRQMKRNNGRVIERNTARELLRKYLG